MISSIVRVDYKKKSLTVNLDNVDYLIYIEENSTAVFRIVLISGQEVEIEEEHANNFGDLMRVYLDCHTKWKKHNSYMIKLETEFEEAYND